MKIDICDSLWLHPLFADANYVNCRSIYSCCVAPTNRRSTKPRSR